MVISAAFGIGRAITRRFAAKGAQVVILDPRRDPIEGDKSTGDLIEESPEYQQPRNNQASPGNWSLKIYGLENGR